MKKYTTMFSKLCLNVLLPEDAKEGIELILNKIYRAVGIQVLKRGGRKSKMVWLGM